jgi:hypothetical protein
MAVVVVVVVVVAAASDCASLVMVASPSVSLCALLLIASFASVSTGPSSLARLTRFVLPLLPLLVQATAGASRRVAGCPLQSARRSRSHALSPSRSVAAAPPLRRRLNWRGRRGMRLPTNCRSYSMTSTSSQPHLQGHRQGQRQQALLFPEQGEDQHEEEDDEEQTLALSRGGAGMGARG